MKAQDLTQMLETGEKTPDEICPVLYAMSILGQRWKLPILWHLADEGPLRYNELKRGIPLITNIMLTQALRELEKSHLVDRFSYDTIPPHVEYSVSVLGERTMPLLEAINQWGTENLLKAYLETHPF